MTDCAETQTIVSFPAQEPSVVEVLQRLLSRQSSRAIAPAPVNLKRLKRVASSPPRKSVGGLTSAPVPRPRPSQAPATRHSPVKALHASRPRPATRAVHRPVDSSLSVFNNASWMPSRAGPRSNLYKTRLKPRKSLGQRKLRPPAAFEPIPI